MLTLGCQEKCQCRHRFAAAAQYHHLHLQYCQWNICRTWVRCWSRSSWPCYYVSRVTEALYEKTTLYCLQHTRFRYPHFVFIQTINQIFSHIFISFILDVNLYHYFNLYIYPCFCVFIWASHFIVLSRYQLHTQCQHIAEQDKAELFVINFKTTIHTCTPAVVCVC